MSCCCGTQTEMHCQCQAEKEPKATSSLIRRIVGPYPDEIIMSILDRILYMWGAAGISHSTDSETCEPASKSKSCSDLSSCPSICSLDRKSLKEASSSCCKTRNSSPVNSKALCLRKDSPDRSSTRPSCIKSTSSRISAASSCPRQRTPRVDFSHPADDIRKRQNAGSLALKEHLKRSISACSLACQRFRTSLMPKESTECQRLEQKWLWTRLVHTKNGCKMYEVYHDSSADRSPAKMASQSPTMVFLVMRNGHIMPFESVTAL